MAKTIAALFDNRTDAHDAVQDLIAHGFAREDIGVMAHEDTTSDTHVTADNGSSGVAQGAGIGAALGGIGGLVIGLTALTVPGIGPALVAGPLAVAALGAGVGAAAGGLIGALTDIGVPEEHAHYYGEGIRRGGVLVTVATSEERAEEATTILSRHHPIDLSRRVEEWRQEGWTHPEPLAETRRTAEAGMHRGTDVAPAERPAASRATATPASASDQHDRARQGVAATMPVVEEDVQVGKRPTEHHTRVHTTMQEQPVEEQVRLREERVNVERYPADRPASAADQAAFKESVIDVPETVEEPVVTKQPRVVEEVVVHKEARDRVETVHDTARRTEVQVEREGDRQGSAMRRFEDYDAGFRKHFATAFAHHPGATYDGYMPAYRYGYTLASDPRYSNRDWDMCSAEVQRDWEREHPGTWERFKEAIRHAWNEVRGRS